MNLKPCKAAQLYLRASVYLVLAPSGADSEPWRHNPADILRLYSGGIVIDELVTPWDGFIRRDPAHVTVELNSAINAIHAWRNVPSFGF